MGRRGDRRPKEVMNPGCPSDKRNLRNRLWQAGRDNDADHNGTSSQLPKDLGRVPAAFPLSVRRYSLFTLYIRNFLHIPLLEYMLQKASPQGETTPCGLML